MNQEKSVKNLFFGLLSFVVTTLLGILIPRLFLLSYGSEVNGLINSVKQVFAYFSLLEAGVGGAALQALYGPMARKDKKEISSILSATNSFFKKTGIIYLIGVIALAVIYPFTVKSDIPKYVVICIIVFQGEAGVIKYFVTSKLQLLLRVDGKSYVLTNVGTIFAVLSNIARIVLLYAGANVLWVQGIFCIVDVLQVLIIVAYVRKKYSWLNLKEKPNFKAVSQKNDVLVHQISSLIFSNTDMLILTYFCGLKTVSVYAMYAMLFGMVSNIISYISSSVNFALGQLFNSNRKQFVKVHETYETFYLAISFSLFTVALIFITPFLKLYTSGVNDISYVDKWLPILFVVYHLLNYGRLTSNLIIDIAGHFKQTKVRSIIESTINIVVSLICVNKFGIYGVLIGTIVALFYRGNDIIIYANKKIMLRSPLSTYRRWFRNAFLLIILALVGNKILPNEYGNYLQLIFTSSVVTIVSIVVFFGVNILFEKTARQTARQYISIFMQNNIKKGKS